MDGYFFKFKLWGIIRRGGINMVDDGIAICEDCGSTKNVERYEHIFQM